MDVEGPDRLNAGGLPMFRRGRRGNGCAPSAVCPDSARRPRDAGRAGSDDTQRRPAWRAERQDAPNDRQPRGRVNRLTEDGRNGSKAADEAAGTEGDGARQATPEDGARRPPAGPERLKEAIDEGQTGDKVAHPDPAAAPLGADAEAAGAGPDAATVDETLARERARDVDRPHDTGDEGDVSVWLLIAFAVLVAVIVVVFGV